jgi:hypothetical protein
MNSKLHNFLLRLLLEESGEVAVTPEPVAAADPAPVSSDPAPASDPAAATVDPVPATPDPNDPFAALQAAMDAGLGADEPAPDPNAPPAVPPAIPAEFSKVLEISPYVKTPESLQQAVSAATEVWDVTNGKVPVSQLLEGMRQGNPDGYQKVVNDFAHYLEQVTGRKLTDQPAAPPDPNQARLDALEAKYAEQEQERHNAALQQQIQTADKKGAEFITSKLKGTFAEGQEAFIMPLIAAQIGDRSKAMQEILAGNTKTLETALKSVTKSMAPVIKAFNANLIKQHKALAGAVPAGKNNPAKAPAGDFAPKPGESASEQVARLLKEGKL